MLESLLSKPEPPPHLDEMARAIIGAAIEVHRRLGPGFLEAVYEESFVIELQHRGISVARQVPIKIFYRDREVAEARLDLLVEHELVVEIKSVELLLPVQKKQLLTCLRLADKRLGLFITQCSKI